MTTIIVPRLARDAARTIIEKNRTTSLWEITSAMPLLIESVTYSPVGGTRATDAMLQGVRDSVVAIARDLGMPREASPSAKSRFDGTAARVLHADLPMTPYEASHEEVWSYLTCAWLLDVAMWRFGQTADERRFIGDINRSTLRRLWWRAEILGPEIDLAQLGEDELTSIMERPTLTADRRVAQAIAREFLDRVSRGEADQRMHLMRDAMKRLLRLTPLLEFSAFEDSEVQALIQEIFDISAASLAGRTTANATQRRASRPALSSSQSSLIPVSPTVSEIPRVVIGSADRSMDLVGEPGDADFGTVEEVALDIARRTGRVTNSTLREVVPMKSDEAREVFAALIAKGELVQKGAKRGTHYTIPEVAESDPSARVTASREFRPDPAGGVTVGRVRTTALRRMLRRRK